MATMKYFNTTTQQWERVDSGAVNDGTNRMTPSDIKSSIGQLQDALDTVEKSLLLDQIDTQLMLSMGGMV